MISLPVFRSFLGAFIVLTLVLSSGCNTNKKVTETATIDRPLGPADYISVFAQNQVQAEWLNGSARLSFDDGDMSIGGTATIKMQKGKAIWMSVKKFGFEVARAMVTPDSLFILDRFNKEYAAEPISYISERFKLPADLAMLQQILLGNPVFLTQYTPKSSMEENILRWSAEDEDARNDFWFLLPGYQLDRMEVQQGGNARSLAIQLLDYQDAGTNRDFSYLRKIAVNSRETGKADIEIEFTQVELNVPTNIDFSVPPRYERMSK
ncbi:DUF4292 domain-containing protein [Lewinella cohaerens]|uniref:DUF4292 domain-containing protein n=1 Tax=Lewinella cohaerens TaxID=70995 RepID=UPI000378F003|nr:DUF4292 domain-containing protein [Lewinella cohaerens]